MPEAPLPPGAALHALAATRQPGVRPAWLDEATFAAMHRAACVAGSAEDAVGLAREVVAARYPALPAAFLSDAAALASLPDATRDAT